VILKQIPTCRLQHTDQLRWNAPLIEGPGSFFACQVSTSIQRSVRCATRQVSRQTAVPGSGAEPKRNSFVRRGKRRLTFRAPLK
jgi:hypothetical protein